MTEKLTIEQVKEKLIEKGYYTGGFKSSGSIVGGGFLDGSSGIRCIEDSFIIEPNNIGGYVLKIGNVSLEQALNIVLDNVKIGKNIEAPPKETTTGPQDY